MFSDSLLERLTDVLPAEQSRVSLQDEVAQLFEQMREGVFRYVLSLGLHPPQAQEATQEVFLRLYSALKRAEPIQNRRAWVVRVAHNLALKLRAQQNSQMPPGFSVGPSNHSRLSSLSGCPRLAKPSASPTSEFSIAAISGAVGVRLPSPSSSAPLVPSSGRGRPTSADRSGPARVKNTGPPFLAAFASKGGPRPRPKFLNP